MEKDRGEESMLSGLGYKPREIVQKENASERLQNEIVELEE